LREKVADEAGRMRAFPLTYCAFKDAAKWIASLRSQ